jgi:transposase InsO family protein
LWFTDITEHPTVEGRIYCAAAMDVYSRIIIGWSINSHMRTELGMAILRRKPASDTILHPTTDRDTPHGHSGNEIGTVTGRRSSPVSARTPWFVPV